MKILAMIMLVLLILAVGFVGYVYKKNAMFLPALDAVNFHRLRFLVQI